LHLQNGFRIETAATRAANVQGQPSIAMRTSAREHRMPRSPLVWYLIVPYEREPQMIEFLVEINHVPSASWQAILDPSFSSVAVPPWTE